MAGTKSLSMAVIQDLKTSGEGAKARQLFDFERDAHSVRAITEEVLFIWKEGVADSAEQCGRAAMRQRHA